MDEVLRARSLELETLVLALIAGNRTQEAAKESLGIGFLFFSVYCLLFNTKLKVSSKMLRNLTIKYCFTAVIRLSSTQTTLELSEKLVMLI